MKLHGLTAAKLLLVTGGWLALSSCGGGSAGNEDLVVGSCNTPATGFCVDYGADYQAATLDKLCKSQKGEYSTGACPIEGRVGSCLVNKGKKSASTYRYYPGFPGYGVTPPEGVPAAAQEQCVNSIKGDWSAG